jgi:hypothetical protein
MRQAHDAGGRRTGMSLVAPGLVGMRMHALELVRRDASFSTRHPGMSAASGLGGTRGWMTQD